jgi:hypothetical protein
LIYSEKLLKINDKRLVLFKSVSYLYYITMRDMNTHITILEFIVIGGLSILGYVLVKTMFETLKSK